MYVYCTSIHSSGLSAISRDESKAMTKQRFHFVFYLAPQVGLEPQTIPLNTDSVEGLGTWHHCELFRKNQKEELCGGNSVVLFGCRA